MTLPLIIGGLVVVAAVAALVFFLTRGDDDSTTTSSSGGGGGGSLGANAPKFTDPTANDDVLASLVNTDFKVTYQMKGTNPDSNQPISATITLASTKGKMALTMDGGGKPLSFSSSQAGSGAQVTKIAFITDESGVSYECRKQTKPDKEGCIKKVGEPKPLTADNLLGSSENSTTQSTITEAKRQKIAGRDARCYTPDDDPGGLTCVDAQTGIPLLLQSSGKSADGESTGFKGTLQATGAPGKSGSKDFEPPFKVTDDPNFFD